MLRLRRWKQELHLSSTAVATGMTLWWWKIYWFFFILSPLVCLITEYNDSFCPSHSFCREQKRTEICQPTITPSGLWDIVVRHLQIVWKVMWKSWNPSTSYPLNWWLSHRSGVTGVPASSLSSSARIRQCERKAELSLALPTLHWSSSSSSKVVHSATIKSTLFHLLSMTLNKYWLVRVFQKSYGPSLPERTSIIKRGWQWFPYVLLSRVDEVALKPLIHSFQLASANHSRLFYTIWNLHRRSNRPSSTYTII